MNDGGRSRFVFIATSIAIANMLWTGSSARFGHLVGRTQGREDSTWRRCRPSYGWSRCWCPCVGPSSGAQHVGIAALSARPVDDVDRGTPTSPAARGHARGAGHCRRADGNPQPKPRGRNSRPHPSPARRRWRSSALRTCSSTGRRAAATRSSTPGVNGHGLERRDMADEVDSGLRCLRRDRLRRSTGCFEDQDGVWGAAVDNKQVWSTAVSGNVIINGTDPDFHGKTRSSTSRSSSRPPMKAQARACTSR